MTTELLPAAAGPSEINLAIMPRADSPAIWGIYREQTEKLKETALTITVTDASDKAGMKLARETRLALRQIRIAVEDRRKELKEGIVKRGQEIDGAARELRTELESLEARLEGQEQFAIREAARIDRELQESRAAEISPFLSGPPSPLLSKLSEDEYAAALTDARDAHEMRMDRERKAADAAAAQKKADDEAREAQRLENIRLKAQAAERAKTHAAELAAVEARNRSEREAREEVARLDRQKAAKAAAEARRLKDADDARKAKDAADKAAADKAARAAAAAPDIDKLRAYCRSLIDLGIPEFANAELGALLKAARVRYQDQITQIATIAKGGSN